MLPKASRLTEKSDFDNVKQKGKFIRTNDFTVSYLERPARSEDAALAGRFGFIVSKKVSMKATERNRVKRMLREIIRQNLDKVQAGDYVIVAKSSIVSASRDKIRTELENVIKNI